MRLILFQHDYPVILASFTKRLFLTTLICLGTFAENKDHLFLCCSWLSVMFFCLIFLLCQYHAILIIILFVFKSWNQVLWVFQNILLFKDFSNYSISYEFLSTVLNQLVKTSTKSLLGFSFWCYKLYGSI